MSSVIIATRGASYDPASIYDKRATTRDQLAEAGRCRGFGGVIPRGRTRPGAYAAPVPARRPLLKTLRTLLRRVLMWAALAAAVGIGVVWAGGRATRFHCVNSFDWPRPEQGRISGPAFCEFRGVRGGFLIACESWPTALFGGMYGPDLYALRTMWLPSLHIGNAYDWKLRIPYWLPTLLCLAAFALLFRIERRAKRRARVGACVACGYDLVGVAGVAAGVCPECGKAVAGLEGRH